LVGQGQSSEVLAHYRAPAFTSRVSRVLSRLATVARGCVKKRPWMLHTLRAQQLHSTLLYSLLSCPSAIEGGADVGSRSRHVNHPSDIMRSGAGSDLWRLSAAAALSTSDSRQGLFGNQSVQGDRPRPIVLNSALLSIVLMPLSIVAHHRVVISLDCRPCYLGAS
jgi:hypothetical protein